MKMRRGRRRRKRRMRIRKQGGGSTDRQWMALMYNTFQQTSIVCTFEERIDAPYCDCPRLANCPKESSRKKRGRPTNARVPKYGIKKAPGKNIATIIQFRKFIHTASIMCHV